MRIFRAAIVGAAASVLLAFFLLATAHARADEPRPQAFDIGPQSLAAALSEFARQSHEELLFAPEVVAKKSSSGVHGTMVPQAALRILLKDSGLSFSATPSGAILVGAPGSATPTSQQSPAETKPSDQQPRSSLQLAQATPGQTQGDISVEQQEEEAAKRKASLQEVVVTGSRIPQTASGAQYVKTYDREEIDRSGEATVADFLNTLPEVSIATGENITQTIGGATTIQLHGLPQGATLVLINGRRVETSGAEAAADFFDLNNIPLAAVERFEIVPIGSSAVYGSDAIAGVVNVILRKNIDGLEGSIKYGGASGINETDVSLSWGKLWDTGSLSIVGSYQTRGELQGFERSATASQDQTRFGGPDNRLQECNPGNVYSTNGANLPGVGAPYAAVPQGFTGTPSQQEFAGTAGTLNKCSIFGYFSFIPETHRTGVLLQGDHQLAPSIDLFMEVLFNHDEQLNALLPPGMFGIPGFQSFTVSASNPYNPFGETVGISGLLTPLGRIGLPLDTDFLRTVLGARGDVNGSWHWEIAGSDSRDWSTLTITDNLNAIAVQNALNSSNPSTALNPFVEGSYGPQSLLESLLSPNLLTKYYSRTQAINGFVRGPLVSLPSGDVQLAFGGEYDHDAESANQTSVPGPTGQTSGQRDRYAVFGESRIPLWSHKGETQAPDKLAVTVAARYDKYSDFGSKLTPQFAIEARPFDPLLIRGTYGRSFKAPPLGDLFAPTTSTPGQTIVDPSNGQTDVVTVTQGGNRSLRPETGTSRTLGVIYSSDALPKLRLSATYWSVNEADNIQNLSLQTILNNEALFPGRVIRNAAGVITQINVTYINFGEIDVKGMDYQASYTMDSASGEYTPSLSVTQTDKYSAALLPGVPPTDRTSRANDDGNWAPRWKGTAALTWKLGPFSAAVDGRYIGSYQDYDSTRIIGNFWLFDGSVRLAFTDTIGRNTLWLRNAYLEVGGVNLFNRLPQYSNFDFGDFGYDPATSDLRGRFLYAQVGAKW